MDQTMLEQAGYTLLAPGILTVPDTAPAPPPGILVPLRHGTPEVMHTLAARAWLWRRQ